MRNLNWIKSAFLGFLVAVLAFATLGGTPAYATVYYWDINGSVAGAGGPTPTGTWSTSTANWTIDPAGALGTSNWTNTASRAYFSAGSDATGSFNVTIGAGTPTATQEVGFKNVTIASGNITFNGGALTLTSINYLGGFDIAAGASATMGTATIVRNGTLSAFTYLGGSGTFYTPGFSALATNQTIVVDGGAWDFGAASSIGANRTMVIEGTTPAPNVFQGNGTFTRAIGTSANQVYWIGGGGFAARGGTLNVLLNNSAATALTFGATNHIFSGYQLVFGSPTADSMVDFQNNVNLGTAAQTVNVWNPNNVAGNVARMSGVISSGAGGSLTKIGAGVLELTAANTYTGGTFVNEGTLLLNNTAIPAAGTGLVTVNVNGKLGGTGSTTSAVNVFGHLAPGASTESLGVGNLTMQTNSFFDVEFGGLNPGAAVNGYDQLNVTGTVNLGGANLDISTLSFTPTKGDTFYILTNDGSDMILGTFAGLGNNSAFQRDGNWWRILYNADFASLSFILGSGNDIALQSIAPVPEPSTFAMLGLSVALVASVRRRRRSQPREQA